MDNTVGEDWDQVELSLVAGAPQSFIQRLSQPYYTRRPEVPLPAHVSLAPQTYQAALTFGGRQLTGNITDPAGGSIAGARVRVVSQSGQTLSETTSDAAGRYEVGGLPEGTVRVEIRAAGFRRWMANNVTIAPGRLTPLNAELQIGSVAETVTVEATAPSVQTSSSSAVRGRSLPAARAQNYAFRAAMPEAIAEVRTQSAPDVQAQDLGNLFEYKLKEPITIRKNQSAMVPIVQTETEAERVTIWNPASADPRPQRALWINNVSNLTLDGGSFSVLEDETFAGEGIVDLIRPGEKRLANYAVDLALSATSRATFDQTGMTRVRAARGVLIQESEERERHTYTLRNTDANPRIVLIEHPVRAGYVLRGEAKPVEETADWRRFRVPVGAKQTAELQVEEARTAETSFQVSDLNADQVALFVRNKLITPQAEEMLRRIAAQREVAAGIESRKETLEEEVSTIHTDQQRLRENMKSLKGSAEEKALLQRYTQQLNQQEDRLEALKKEIAAAAKQHEAADEQLNRIIDELVFDVKL